MSLFARESARARLFAILGYLALAVFLAAGCSGRRAFSSPGPDAVAPSAGDAPQAGDTGSPAYDPAANAAPPAGQEAAAAAVWQPLILRLASDGISGSEVNALFASLSATPTQSPMGRKMRELYMRRFFPKPRTGKAAQRYYKGVVTAANARICRDFLSENQEAFAAAENRYGVPSHIAVALLFVETRLGKVLADVSENAFYTLASMAVCRQPQDISDWLSKMPGYERHLDWFADVMPQRADWAYNETRALIQHMLREKIAPQSLPSSIYGAVGLCQFMPSNISVYGADGNGDGRVDLFDIPDAVASLSNYLVRHGWKAGISRTAQHRLLMTYNHSQVYANTILALGDLVAKTSTPPAPVPQAKGSI